MGFLLCLDSVFIQNPILFHLTHFYTTPRHGVRGVGGGEDGAMPGLPPLHDPGPTPDGPHPHCHQDGRLPGRLCAPMSGPRGLYVHQPQARRIMRD